MANDTQKTERMPIRDMLGSSDVSLTRSESRIVQLLLADYPVAGLGSASSLAKRAGVSDPTVARFVTKFGFENFAAFQAALLEDVEARLRSPLMMLETKQAGDEHDAIVNRYMASVTQKLRDATEAAVPEPYDRAVDLIMGAKGGVTLVGGRFSRHVAGMLAGYLLQLRSDVHSISPLTLESFDRLVDISRRDTLIVFDYRRYQTDVVEFARQAEARGAHVILFTDPWMSPVAEFADVVIIASVEVDSPYDSLAPAVAQMEALVAHAVVREKRVMERRVADLEKLRSANAVTVDEPAP
ncbi:MurR/RpiR family transcriptional regulator [Sphingomonas sp.]|uniref:MurR/RpiR family transcriptional regulator n=1 Tax=Sphingomonas sp. TaxID=28214 RepID=UPI002C403D5D|nr:MurR/RpiR family transcriptional regulator [Sphingomonas sp.]HWK36966.1 MurR/RpiR family transcriptional regulator [Sphingomonas sp.]